MLTFRCPTGSETACLQNLAALLTAGYMDRLGPAVYEYTPAFDFGVELYPQRDESPALYLTHDGKVVLRADAGRYHIVSAATAA